MKRGCCLLTAALLLFSLLTACGEKTPAAETVIDLETVYQDILDAQANNGMETLVFFPESNPEFIDSCYPGLSAIALTQQFYYVPPVFGFACEIMLVEVTSENDVQTVRDIFQARIDNGASDPTYPENAEPWANNAQIQQSGRYLCMIVLPDGYTIPENVFAAG